LKTSTDIFKKRCDLHTMFFYGISKFLITLFLAIIIADAIFERHWMVFRTKAVDPILVALTNNATLQSSYRINSKMTEGHFSYAI
jgi:hypothetical protein